MKKIIYLNNRTPSPSSQSESDINLFGPPPVLEGFENSRAETIKYRNSKARQARRSDQKKNRLFEDAFNLNYIAPVTIETVTPGISPKSDDHQSTPEQLGTVRQTYSNDSYADHQSIGSLSITPIDFAARSVSDASESLVCVN